MKFKNEKDKKQFEILEVNEKILRKKLQIVKKSIDRKKQRNAKNDWRRNRLKKTLALRKWHKSTDGKRFHRSLGRFLATRENNDNVSLTTDEITDALLGLSSIETHLFLELKYYEPDIIALNEFLEVLYNFNEDSKLLKDKLLDCYISGYIENEYYELLQEIFEFFVDIKYLLYTVRSLNNLSNDEKELSESELKSFKEDLKIIENKEIDYNEMINNLFEKYKGL